MDFHFGENDEAADGGGGNVAFVIDDGITERRRQIIATIPRITGTLSALGSAFILLDVFRDEKKYSTVYHRLVFCMSISDLVASVGYALSTLPIPVVETGENAAVHGASGTVGTCTAQGFWIQLGGLATPLYSASLALYYVLGVVRGWRDEDRKMRKAEIFMHVTSWGLASSTALIALALNLYNSANLWCWIAPYPVGCDTGSAGGDPTVPCERGAFAWMYRLAFYFVWLWMCVLVVTTCMGMVFCKVYKQARRVQKHSFDQKFQGKHVYKVAVQSLLYIGAFLITAVFPSVARMAQAKLNCTSQFYPVTLLTVTFFPLQGFWNFLIYIRPRFLRYRSSHKDWSLWRTFKETIRRTMHVRSWDGTMTLHDSNDYKDGLPGHEDVSTTVRTSTLDDTTGDGLRWGEGSKTNVIYLDDDEYRSETLRQLEASKSCVLGACDDDDNVNGDDDDALKAHPLHKEQDTTASSSKEKDQAAVGASQDHLDKKDENNLSASCSGTNNSAEETKTEKELSQFQKEEEETLEQTTQNYDGSNNPDASSAAVVVALVNKQDNSNNTSSGNEITKEAEEEQQCGDDGGDDAVSLPRHSGSLLLDEEESTNSEAIQNQPPALDEQDVKEEEEEDQEHEKEQLKQQHSGENISDRRGRGTEQVSYA